MFKRSTAFRLLSHLALVLSTIPLSACIFTTEPAFDDGSSVPASDSKELKAFIDDTIGLGFSRFAPFFGGEKAVGVTRVFHASQRRIFLQFSPPDCPEEESFCAMYYIVGIEDTGRPFTCFADLEDRTEWETAAEASGVSASFRAATRDKGGTFGPDVLVAGDVADVRAFIIDRLENGPLKCEVWEPDPSAYDRF